MNKKIYYFIIITVFSLFVHCCTINVYASTVSDDYIIDLNENQLTIQNCHNKTIISINSGSTDIMIDNKENDTIEEFAVSLSDIEDWNENDQEIIDSIKPFFTNNLYNLFFSDNIVNINDSVIARDKINSVSLGNNTKKIGSYVFSKAKFSEIKIPESLEYIGTYAFSECNSLSDIIFSPNIKIIDYKAFYNCTSLNNITILSKDVIINDGVFGIKSDSSVNSERIIRGYAGSTAETYANENGFTFIPLDEPVTEVTASATEEVITESTTTQPVITDSVTHQSQSTVITDAANAKVNSTPKTGEKNIYGITALGISAAVLSVVSSKKKTKQRSLMQKKL